jgi:hypothetical protein
LASIFAWLGGLMVDGKSVIKFNQQMI